MLSVKEDMWLVLNVDNMDKRMMPVCTWLAHVGQDIVIVVGDAVEMGQGTAEVMEVDVIIPLHI
jgi:hypothetical protein